MKRVLLLLVLRPRPLFGTACFCPAVRSSPATTASWYKWTPAPGASASTRPVGGAQNSARAHAPARVRPSPSSPAVQLRSLLMHSYFVVVRIQSLFDDDVELMSANFGDVLARFIQAKDTT